MILLFVASVILASFILYCAKTMRLRVRLALALVALLLVNAPTIVFLVVGNKAPPGARTVKGEELREAAE